MKIQLKRSNVLEENAAKQPTSEQLEYGELAVNYSKDDPAIFLKTSSNQIIRIAGEGSYGSFDGDYNNLENKPTIGNGKLTVNDEDGNTLAEFTANQTGDVTCEIPNQSWSQIVDKPIYIQTETPSSPSNGEIWVDLNGCPPELKIWSDCNGTGDWRPITGGGGSGVSFDIRMTGGDLIGDTKTVTISNTLPLDGVATYQWLVNGIVDDSIPSNQNTRVNVATDLGFNIVCQATYLALTKEVTSDNVVEIPPIEFAVDVTSTVTAPQVNPDDVLTVTVGAVTGGENPQPDPLETGGRVWQRDGVAMDPAETGETYTLTESDIGTTISCAVTYTDDYGASKTVTGTFDKPIVAPPIIFTVTVTDNGTNVYGQCVLTASLGPNEPTGGINPRIKPTGGYTWKKRLTANPSDPLTDITLPQNSALYAPTEADNLHTIFCEVVCEETDDPLVTQAELSNGYDGNFIDIFIDTPQIITPGANAGLNPTPVNPTSSPATTIEAAKARNLKNINIDTWSIPGTVLRSPRYIECSGNTVKAILGTSIWESYDNGDTYTKVVDRFADNNQYWIAWRSSQGHVIPMGGNGGIEVVLWYGGSSISNVTNSSLYGNNSATLAFGPYKGTHGLLLNTGQSGQNYPQYTLDGGSSWNQCRHNINGTSPWYVNDCAYGNGFWVMTQDYGVIVNTVNGDPSELAYMSFNYSAPYSFRLGSIAFGNTVFVALPINMQSSAECYVGKTGVDWVKYPVPTMASHSTTEQNIIQFDEVSRQFVIFECNTRNFHTSRDGKKWVKREATLDESNALVFASSRTSIFFTKTDGDGQYMVVKVKDVNRPDYGDEENMTYLRFDTIFETSVEVALETSEIFDDSGDQLDGNLEDAFDEGSNVTTNRGSVFEVLGVNSRKLIIEPTGNPLEVSDRFTSALSYTPYAPSNSDLIFSAAPPSFAGVSAWGDATWEVSTDSGFTPENTMTTSIPITVPTYTQLLFPYQRGDINLKPNTQYWVRVSYASVTPPYASAPSVSTTFKTSTLTDGWINFTGPPGSYRAVCEGIQGYAWWGVANFGRGTNSPGYYAEPTIVGGWNSISSSRPIWSIPGDGNVKFAKYAVKFNDDYIVVGTDGNTGGSAFNCQYSADGVYWAMCYVADDTGARCNGLAVNDDHLVFVGIAGIYYQARTGAAPTSAWTRINLADESNREHIGAAYGVVNGQGIWAFATANGLFANVEAPLESGKTTQFDDGITRKHYMYPGSCHIAFGVFEDGVGRFVAAGGSTDIWWSEDGKNWYAASADKTNWSNSINSNVMIANGRAVIFLSDTQGNIKNRIAVSTDGKVWTNYAAPPMSSEVWATAFVDNKFIALSYKADNNENTKVALNAYSEGGAGPQAQFLVYDESRGQPITDVDVVNLYGTNPLNNLGAVGIYQLDEQPDYPIHGYIKKDGYYTPARDLTSALEATQIKVDSANARLDEANATIETLRSNLEDRISALESES